MIAPLTLPQATDALREVIERVQPEMIHAMRIPFEGMIAGKSLRHNVQAGGKAREIPLLVSVWGNDFTLHAKSSPLMAYYTRQTLKHCHALHTDCQRDLNLAKALGFATDKPAIVLPGGGGIDLEVFHPAEESYDEHGGNYLSMEGLRVRIINPRGFRAYVRNDTFFHAIPMVLQRYPDAHFVCPGMAGEAQALKWVAELEIGEHVDLLPPQSMQGMAELFRKSQISLSITTHDGTPNTLLEAFACGCFPIAGDIEALREWITPGKNGLLVNPGDPQALSAAILSAISQPELRKKAREINLELVNERAEYGKTMRRAEAFYNQLLFSYS
jgi:glycosyltransferase involved in cell wall biosynthesis